MFRYILKRLIQMIPMIFIISIIAFTIIRIAEVYAGADPLAQLKLNPTVTEETIRREKLRIGYESFHKETIKLESEIYTPKYLGLSKKISKDSIKVNYKNSGSLKYVLPIETRFFKGKDLLLFNKADNGKKIRVKYQTKKGAVDETKILVDTIKIREDIVPGTLQVFYAENEAQLGEMTLQGGEFTFVGKNLYFHSSDIGKELEIEYNTLNTLVERYIKWAFGFIRGDMGESYYYKTKVSGLIFERIGNTLVLSITTITFTWLVAIPLGIFLAVRQYSLIDQIFSSISYFFMGFPDFFLAILFLLFAASSGLFPITGMVSTTNNNWDKVKSIFQCEYQHLPGEKHISQSHNEYDRDIHSRTEKQKSVNEIKQLLKEELDNVKDKLSGMTSGEVMRKLDNLIEDFPDKELLSIAKTELSTSGVLSVDTGRKILKNIKKLKPLSFTQKWGYIFKHISYIFYHFSRHVPDVLHHLILPALTLSLIEMASLQRRMRASLLDVLNEEYIRTARAKGLPENKVIYKHAVRNAINPLVTMLGYEFAVLISGAAFVEIIFTWPGIGQMTLEAVLGSDLNLVMASLVMSSTMLILGNLIADLLLALVDPRIKLEA